jgi:flagellar basal body rod protein FlgC
LHRAGVAGGGFSYLYCVQIAQRDVHHKRTTKQLSRVISHNVALTNELNTSNKKPNKRRSVVWSCNKLVLTNRRLTVQISNLKTHLVQLSEQLQTAKNSKQTVVLPITPNEQNQTSNHVKKSKTA